MANVIVSYSDVVQGVSSNGTQRWVEATVDFDTGDYVSDGIPLPLGALGLSDIRETSLILTATADNFQTEAQKITGAYWYPIVSISGTATPTAPKLLLYAAGSVHTVAAVNAAVQFRIRFYGT